MTRNLILLLSVVLSGRGGGAVGRTCAVLAPRRRARWRPTREPSCRPCRISMGPRVTDATFDDKVLIVTFFASWCPPCRQEFADLSDLYRQHREDGLEVVAINLFEDFDDFSDDRTAGDLSRSDPTPFRGGQKATTPSRSSSAPSDAFPACSFSTRRGRRVLTFAHERGAQAILDAAALRQIISPLL